MNVTLDDLCGQLDEQAVETGFSGVFRIDDADRSVTKAYGLADRRFSIPNTPSTLFAIASGTKSITSLTVLSLIEDGVLSFDTPARSLLGTDLPLIDDRVTVEQLLTHRSGIGDYLDEDQLEGNDYVLPIPSHLLADANSYLQVLGGYPQVFDPGTEWAYNNGAYVVLAIIAERATGVPYHQLTTNRVLVPAGMNRSGFVRSDDVPADAATGHVDATGTQTNTLHMPLLGVGDGGLYSSADDVASFWAALTAGRIVSSSMVERALRPLPATDGFRYGMGFWMPMEGPTVQMEGSDPGVSFRSTHDPSLARTVTVLSNTGDGAWPLVAHARASGFLTTPR
jgi:CubicO group peptidase (beta-lactamase class C family)